MIENLIIISGIALVSFGFVHYVLLDWLFPYPNAARAKMKKWAGITTISLTITFLSGFLITLVKFLWGLITNKTKPNEGQN